MRWLWHRIFGHPWRHVDLVQNYQLLDARFGTNYMRLEWPAQCCCGLSKKHVVSYRLEDMGDGEVAAAWLWEGME